MKKTLIAFCVLCNLSFGKLINQSEIQIESFIVEGPYKIIKTSDGSHVEPSTRFIIIDLKNKSNALLRIPTAYFSFDYTEENPYLLIKINWKEADEARKIIIPESRLNIVELNKDEIARIEIELPKYFPVSNKSIYVIMEASPGFSAKYKLDHFGFRIAVGTDMTIKNSGKKPKQP